MRETRQYDLAEAIMKDIEEKHIRRRLRGLVVPSCLTLITVLALYGCGMGLEEGEYEVYREPMVQGEVQQGAPGDYARPEEIAAEHLEQGLPGCEEALGDPALDVGAHPSLGRIVESPELGVLMEDGRQVCVDEFDLLDLWITTGKWTSEKMDLPEEEVSPTTYDGESSDMGQDHELRGTSHSGGQQEPLNENDYPHAKPNLNVKGGSTVSSDPVDDSNPLPPRINPLL